MSDYAQDFATLCVSEAFNENEIEKAIPLYLSHTASMEEKRHLLAYIGLAGWCWHLWSLLKEDEGENIGTCMYTYYKYAKQYVTKALQLYTNN